MNEWAGQEIFFYDDPRLVRQTYSEAKGRGKGEGGRKVGGKGGRQIGGEGRGGGREERGGREGGRGGNGEGVNDI